MPRRAFAIHWLYYVKMTNVHWLCLCQGHPMRRLLHQPISSMASALGLFFLLNAKAKLLNWWNADCMTILLHPSPVHPSPLYSTPVHSIPANSTPPQSTPPQPTLLHFSPLQPSPLHPTASHSILLHSTHSTRALTLYFTRPFVFFLLASICIS